MTHEISIIEERSSVATIRADIPIAGQSLGRPESLGGKLLDVSFGERLRLLSRKDDVRIFFAGSRYRVASLGVDGDFELVGDWTAGTLRELEDQLHHRR